MCDTYGVCTSQPLFEHLVSPNLTQVVIPFNISCEPAEVRNHIANTISLVLSKVSGVQVCVCVCVCVYMHVCVYACVCACMRGCGCMFVCVLWYTDVCWNATLSSFHLGFQAVSSFIHLFVIFFFFFHNFVRMQSATQHCTDIYIHTH